MTPIRKRCETQVVSVQQAALTRVIRRAVTSTDRWSLLCRSRLEVTVSRSEVTVSGSEVKPSAPSALGSSLRIADSTWTNAKMKR